LKHVNDLLIKDIERRNRVERALLASEERARERAELSSDWYWELDERFRFARRSGMTIGRFGLPYWVTLGARPWELPVDLHASDWPAQRAALEAHQPFRNFEMRVLVEGHAVQWCSISGQPLFDAAGAFRGYHGTGRDISARKLAEEELLHSRSMLRKLADHQETVREDERKRIARDIHDDLGQNLLVLKIDVATLHARTGERHPKLNRRVALVLENIDGAVKSLKSIMNDLRPAALDLGLHCAVEWQLQQFERMSGIACELEAPDPPDFNLNEARTLAVFRILQESLSNVLRHAEASEVRVALACDARGFTMRIRDNGKGMAPGSGRKADSFGLIGIKERSYALGGELTLESGPGRGTLLRLFIPARS
jgi:signal transduction histidine kinase